MSKRPNPWIDWVRSEALRLDVPYACAMSLKEVKFGYMKKKLDERIAKRAAAKRAQERAEERRRDPASAKASDAMDALLLRRKTGKQEKKIDDALSRARNKAETERLLNTKLVPKPKRK